MPVMTWSSVQTRIITLVLAVALLAVFGLVTSRSGETRRIDTYLAADAKEHAGLLDRTLELEGGSLAAIAKDYTYWDEMVQFVQTGNRAWASQNIDEAMGTYRANAAWVFDTTGAPVYAAHDSTLEALLEPLPPGLSLKDALGDDRLCHFFIAGSDGPVEIRGATIHPSDDPERKTPVRGYFLVARLWNKQYLAELARLTGKDMTIEPARAGAKPSAEIARQTGEIKFIRPLPGPRGIPELTLTASLRPGWTTVALRSGRGQLALQIALALLGILGLTLVLWLWVTRPLGRLRRSLQSGSTEALKPLERNRTEFGQLAQLVGQFFGQNAALAKEVAERKQTEKTLRESEERFRELFESMSSGVAVYETRDRGASFIFKSLNLGGERIDSLHREEVVGRDVQQIFPGIEEFGLLAVMRRVWQTGKPERHPVGQYKDDRISGWRENYVYKLPSGEVVAVYDDVTARVQAEVALRESEERFRDVALCSADWVWEVDAQGRYTFCSEHVKRVLGYEPGELVGRTPFDLMPEDERTRIAPAFAALLAERRPLVDLENRNLTKDGREVALLTNGVPMLDSDGNLLGYRGVDKDITERKRTEAEVKRHAELQAAINEMLRFSLEDLPLDSILEKSLDTITAIPWLVLDSRGSIHLVEHDPEVLVMKAQRGLADSLLAMCDRVRFGRCLCGRAASTGQLVFADHVDDSHENRYDGIRDHGHYCVPMLSADQRVLGVLNLYFAAGGKRNKETEELLGVVANVLAGVVQRKRAEEALRASEAQLSNAMEIAKLGHWEYDIADDVFTFNDHLYAIFGTTAQKVGGYKMSSAEYARRFVHPDDVAMVGAEVGEAIKTTDPHFSRQLEHRILYADGSVGYISVRFFVVKDARGRTVKTFGANQDITVRKLAEAEIAQKNAELVELNEVKNQLLGMAAHDLRNPLSVINTASAFLLDDASRQMPEAKRAEFIRRINSGSEFMLKLIDDLLDVARIEAGKLDLEMKEENLCGLIEDTLTLNRMLADKKSIRLDFTPECGLPPLRFDRSKVEQVLNNLFSNAIKFSAPGTVIAVQASRVNGSVVVSVRDQGQGIPAEELDKLFKPFGRTSVRATAGEKSTGLGLAICRKIVEGHGGRIWAESVIGDGSTFSFSLPVADEDRP